MPAYPINLEEEKAVTRVSETWEPVVISSGISHWYGKEHSPVVLELVGMVQSDLQGQHRQFFLFPIPYVWWPESYLLPEGGVPLAALSPS